MQASNIVQFLKMLIKNKLSAEVNFRLEAFFLGRGEIFIPIVLRLRACTEKIQPDYFLIRLNCFHGTAPLQWKFRKSYWDVFMNISLCVNMATDQQASQPR